MAHLGRIIICLLACATLMPHATPASPRSDGASPTDTIRASRQRGVAAARSGVAIVPADAELPQMHAWAASRASTIYADIRRLWGRQVLSSTFEEDYPDADPLEVLGEAFVKPETRAAGQMGVSELPYRMNVMDDQFRNWLLRHGVWTAVGDSLTWNPERARAAGLLVCGASEGFYLTDDVIDRFLDSQGMGGSPSKRALFAATMRRRFQDKSNQGRNAFMYGRRNLRKSYWAGIVIDSSLGQVNIPRAPGDNSRGKRSSDSHSAMGYVGEFYQGGNDFSRFRQGDLMWGISSKWLDTNLYGDGVTGEFSVVDLAGKTLGVVDLDAFGVMYDRAVKKGGNFSRWLTHLREFLTTHYEVDAEGQLELRHGGEAQKE